MRKGATCTPRDCPCAPAHNVSVTARPEPSLRRVFTAPPLSQQMPGPQLPLLPLYSCSPPGTLAGDQWRSQERTTRVLRQRSPGLRAALTSLSLPIVLRRAIVSRNMPRRPAKALSSPGALPPSGGLCYNLRAVMEARASSLREGHPGPQAPELPPSAECVSGYCPACSAKLAERSCKLICPVCGYYMSCSDSY